MCVLGVVYQRVCWEWCTNVCVESGVPMCVLGLVYQCNNTCQHNTVPCLVPQWYPAWENQNLK